MAYGRDSLYKGTSIKMDENKAYEFLKEHVPDHPAVYEHENGRASYRFSEFELLLYSIPKDKLQVLYDFLGKDNTESRKVKGYMNLLASFTTKAPKNLRDLVTCVREYIKEKAPSFTLREISTGKLLHMTGGEYHEYDAAAQSPAYTQFILKYVHLGELRTQSIIFNIDSLTSDMTVEKLLFNEGYSIPTEDEVRDYVALWDEYAAVVTSVGKQYITTQTKKVHVRGKDYWHDDSAYVKAGTKCVVDPDDKFKLRRTQVALDWFYSGTNDKGLKMLTAYDDYTVPMFSLSVKIPFEAPFFSLTEYKYNDNIKQDLVLPDDQINALDILMSYDPSDFKDVADNKSAGVIVLASGEPGLGKTLTAEVYAELIHKPLYVVQSSELGIDTQSIETQLQTVLDRASKWKAVLLLDEADTFIRRRGYDLQQNAIVGVFLRTLEYYDGILFMTTNRFYDTDGKVFVDDAILSRVTAHLRYDYPSEDATKAIIDVQAKQLNISIKQNKQAIYEYFKAHKCSGRDIRNFLKLAKMFMAKDNTMELDVTHLDKVAPFHATLTSRK